METIIDTKQTRPVGRPTLYTKELGERICEYISNGMTLRQVAAQADTPCIEVIFRWIRLHEEFSQRYAQATEDRTEAQVIELNEVASQAIQEAKSADPKSSNAIVQAYKLKADNLKWIMARMKPKKYGDKIDFSSDGKPISVNLISYAEPAIQIPATVIE